MPKRKLESEPPPLEPRFVSIASTRGEQSDPREKRVFVTHGKNRELLPQIKELLEFGQFQPIVSVERESVSKPIPDKVMDDMRSCGAAIIHVDADKEVMTPEGEKEVILNGNVLIEIGGAMALYGRRFILERQPGMERDRIRAGIRDCVCQKNDLILLLSEAPAVDLLKQAHEGVDQFR